MTIDLDTSDFETVAEINGELWDALLTLMVLTHTILEPTGWKPLEEGVETGSE